MVSALVSAAAAVAVALLPVAMGRGTRGACSADKASASVEAGAGGEIAKLLQSGIYATSGWVFDCESRCLAGWLEQCTPLEPLRRVTECGILQ